MKYPWTLSTMRQTGRAATGEQDSSSRLAGSNAGSKGRFRPLLNSQP